ncbi:MAG: TetR-like C-terminal domain-containing protein, partial [Caulobacteraceae bacterium]
MQKKRSGGRAAEIKAAVFAAAEALLGVKPPGAISMVDVAERAGVAATSLYRRWGDLPTLLMDVAVERLMRESPLPDTGSLQGDLDAWGARIANSLGSWEGSTFFRVYVATAQMAGKADGRNAAVLRRIEEVAGMLERARARGEHAPTLDEVSDHLVAPLYMRALLAAPIDEALSRALVGRLLNTADGRTGK